MKFIIVNIVAIIILVLLALTGMHWWWYAVAAWVYISIVVLGCIKISWQFFMPVACSAPSSEKAVALSFDDGPHAAYTPSILDTLRRYNVPAAFFCIGRNIAGNEILLHRMNSEGHIVGNHSFSHHFWFDMFGSGSMQADMQQMTEAVERTLGLRPVLFRPPYGVMNPNLKRAIKRGGYIPVGWSIRSLDTAINDKEKLLSRITRDMKGGDIILLHDSMQITADILPGLIQRIQAKGFRIARLDRMLNIKAYA